MVFNRNSDNYQNNYYLLTHTRAAPWFIGVILGYFIFKIKQKDITIRLHKLTAIAIWGICITVLFVCVLGGHSSLRGSDYDQWGNAFHIALVRPVWSLSITWIILACITGYGGKLPKCYRILFFNIYINRAYQLGVISTDIPST